MAGHGTYWEMVGKIAATGRLTSSGNDDSYGECEFHKTIGVYVTPQFSAWGGHYSWPVNVFSNKCFYGVGFRVLGNKRFLAKT